MRVVQQTLQSEVEGPMVKFDLRFVDSGYELMILAEYLRLLEAETAEVIERGRERIRRTEHDTDEEVNRSIVSHLEYRLEEGIMTRFLPASVVMASWAIYEATLKEVADWLAADKGIASIDDASHKLRGGQLKRARKYYKDFLNVELHPTGTDWRRLERLAELRHVLAHANGSLRDVRKKADRDHLRSWVRETPGLSIEDRYILVSLTFASESLRFINGLVEELVERVRETFPLPRKG
jgi:hypothetical protein